MNRLRILVTCLLTALAATASLSSDTPKPKSVKVLAGLEGTPEEGKTYLTANMKLISGTLPEAFKACAAGVPRESVAGFEMVVVVGKGGKPDKVTPEPDNAFTQCVAKTVAGARFTEPPRIPLAVHLEISVE